MAGLLPDDFGVSQHPVLQVNPVGSPGGILGGGGVPRPLPRDNYLTPLSKYTDKLYREMDPQSALGALPGSHVSSGYGLGSPKEFYADHPAMALGQGANRGVRLEYDAGAFHGQINQKPGWEPLFQSGYGEYLAGPRPGFNQRDAVRGVTVDKSAIGAEPLASNWSRILESLGKAGWSINDDGQTIQAMRP